MSQTSTNPALKWILIVIAVVTAIGAVAVFLLATYPAGEYRAARELEKRGFYISYNWYGDDRIWKHPLHVIGYDRMITSDDCRLICQLPRLLGLDFKRCDMSGLNLDDIGNCRELRAFAPTNSTRFPMSELKKLPLYQNLWVKIGSGSFPSA